MLWFWAVKKLCTRCFPSYAKLVTHPYILIECQPTDTYVLHAFEHIYNKTSASPKIRVVRKYQPGWKMHHHWNWSLVQFLGDMDPKIRESYCQSDSKLIII
jgi:hypothetical protein